MLGRLVIEVFEFSINISEPVKCAIRNLIHNSRNNLGLGLSFRELQIHMNKNFLKSLSQSISVSS